MDRARQLSNVAFSGAWSEEIARQEALIAALETLRQAAAQAGAVDPSKDSAVTEVLTLACQEHPRGVELCRAWIKGARLTNPGLRVQELARVANILARGRMAP